MKRGKIVKSEGIKLPNGEVMKQLGQQVYTYLGIFELDKIRKTEMKQKVTKECKRRQRLKADKEKTWQWLSRGDLKVGTEAWLCAAQEQAITTNYMKHHIDKTSEGHLFRQCGKKGESVQHIASGCEKSAQKEYKTTQQCCKEISLGYL